MNKGNDSSKLGRATQVRELRDDELQKVSSGYIYSDMLEHFPSALNRRDSQPLSPRRIWGN